MKRLRVRQEAARRAARSRWWLGRRIRSRFVRSVVVAVLALAAGASAHAETVDERAQTAFDSGEHELAYRLWLTAAEQGNARAQSGLGILYRRGIVVKEDPAQALAWFRKAAAQGDPRGELHLGGMHRRGEGVAKNEAAALDWVRKAAGRGYADAEFSLGWYLQHGIGTTADPQAATGWWLKAAAQGQVDAMYELGRSQTAGDHGQGDPEAAVLWFTKAAELGHAESQYMLAAAYLDGKGLARDESMGFAWMQRAAAQGLKEAEFALANLYYRGRGVAEDKSQSIAWYRRAADQGHENAAIILAGLYGVGNVVPTDPELAIRYARPVAESGNALAQQMLGTALYLRAQARGQVDPEAALWISKAADAGNVEAQFLYGAFLANGLGVAEDLPQAIALWRKAAAAGQAGARCILSVIDAEDRDAQDASLIESLATVGDLLRNAADPECKKWGVRISMSFHLEAGAGEEGNQD